MNRWLPIFVIVMLWASAGMAQSPNGIPAPPGFQWVVSYDEEFTNESSVNTNTWGVASNYSLSSQNGLALQGLPNNTRAQLVNTNDSVLQRYGAWEWLAKFPHNDSGEGTGYHADLYLGDSNAQQPNYIEDDICEWDTAFTPATACQNVLNDVEINGVGRGDILPPSFGPVHLPNGGSGQPPIGDAFHTWGMYWANDGTAHGTVSEYFDGALQTNTIWSLTNPRWDQGMRPIMEEDDCGAGHCSSSGNNPLLVKYFRVWHLVQTGTPTPTPTATPTPVPGSAIYLIGGSSQVIDGGFFTSFYGFPVAAQTYAINSGLGQQYTITPSGTGYTLCNPNYGNACLTDGGTVVDQGQGTDVWTITAAGAQWTLQNQRTSRYMGVVPQANNQQIPMSATAVTNPLIYISGTQLPNTGPPSSYLVGNTFVIDGGFYQAANGYPAAAETFQNNQPNLAQQYRIAASGTGFTLCNYQNPTAGGPPACLTDSGTIIDQGQGTDVWTILQSGSGFTLQDQRTGRYMGAIPQANAQNIPTVTTAAIVPLTYISGPSLFTTPTPTVTPTLSPSPSPSPSPAPSSAPTPVDPNANQTTKNVLAYMASLEGVGVVQSNQSVVATCMPIGDPNGNTGDGGQCLADPANYVADGNQYTKAIGTDPCEGLWGVFEGTISTPGCWGFGSK